jgi:stage II sporulation protein P
MKNSPFIHAETVQTPNPFDDFVLPQQSDGPHQNTISTSYHPQYNVIEEFFPSSESDIVLKKDACYVKNLTHHSAEEVKSLMLSPVSFSVDKNSAQPQILIYHTHATESYTPTADMDCTSGYSWRNTDKAQNMVAVGKTMTDTLNRLGYNTIQDTTLHDYPSYNGSYDLSEETVKKYLEKYPSIKIVLDVHRDAVERNGSLINPVITSQGIKYAQIMIISGCDNGYMNMPNYRENLKFATNLQNQLAKDTPGLVRPILFDYRNYNQQLSTGSILVEIGTHGSTLQQAKNSAEAFAISLANMLDKM